VASEFNLSEKVDELKYNFRPLIDVAGIVPEPSAGQIRAFRRVFGEMLEEAQRELGDHTPVRMGDAGNEPDPLERIRLVGKYLSRDTTMEEEKLLHAMADLCSNQPSFDDLQQLPGRAQQAFLSWLGDMFLVPEGSRPATTT
jgi:hypothetical protein